MTAADFLRSNPRVATTLSARDIEVHIPAAIRQQSFFSAKTITAHHLDETQKDIALMLEGKMGPAEIRNRMKDRLEKLDYKPMPGKEGTLEDLASNARTNLIIDMQEQRARGYAVWRSQQKESILMVWPANELYRAETRLKPRDWKTRWNSARADLGEDGTTATYALSNDGPFVAMKNDAIWTHPDVNRFGSPWTPFDYRSGMRLKQVKASRARALGVLKDGDKGPTPARDPMSTLDSASVGDMSQPIVGKWVSAFGDRARIVDGRVVVCPEPSIVAEILDVAKNSPNARASSPFSFVEDHTVGTIEEVLHGRPLHPGSTFEVSADAVRHTFNEHGEGKERNREQRPITDADITQIPEHVRGEGRWRESNDEEKSWRKGDAVTFIGVDGVMSAWSVSRKRARLSLITLFARKKPGLTSGSMSKKTPNLTP